MSSTDLAGLLAQRGALVSSVDVAAMVRHGDALAMLGAALAALAVLVLLGAPQETGCTPPDGPGADARASRASRDPQRSRVFRRRRVAGAGGLEASAPEVSSALALLALAYRSGLPTWDVLDAVADGLGGPVAADLQQVASALRWGATESEAWGSVGPVWAPAARAVAIAHQAGVPPGSMLLAAADDLRSAELERLEVSAAQVGVRLVAPLGLVLLPAFCLTTVAPLVIALAGGLLRP
ncbi:hypothetical protein GCM10009817_38070 [Terrabacter lapilli]|uniref:Type II secretion system protein GspF domain-containing protein n=1 Tax=Terrabacter lapilli TaxID=436231 RepID=A0ABN2STI1_9MICO